MEQGRAVPHRYGVLDVQGTEGDQHYEINASKGQRRYLGLNSGPNKSGSI
jgi:hypothetical protein